MLSGMSVRRTVQTGVASDSTDVTIGQYCPKSCVIFGYDNYSNFFGSVSQTTLHGETIAGIFDPSSGSGSFVLRLASDGTLGAGWFQSLDVEDADGNTYNILESAATHSTDSSTYDNWTWNPVDPPDWYNDTGNVRTVTMFK